MFYTRKINVLMSAFLLSLAVGCASTATVEVDPEAKLAGRTSSYVDLTSLPKPKGKLRTSVYAFRDQTGQYKPSPSSTFSTALSQGAASMLTEALNDSGWFITLEREGLQNLLTERKIVRATAEGAGKKSDIPALMPADILLEGGLIAYDSNVETGGAAARYLGIGLQQQYRVDQVTVNLRAINVRTGQILHNVSTSKTVYSKQLQSGIFRFIEFKKLLEVEAGYTVNEPGHLCVRAAIDAAVVHMIVDGLDARSWLLADESQMDAPVLSRYRDEVPTIAYPRPQSKPVADKSAQAPVTTDTPATTDAPVSTESSFSKTPVESGFRGDDKQYEHDDAQSDAASPQKVFAYMDYFAGNKSLTGPRR